LQLLETGREGAAGLDRLRALAARLLALLRREDPGGQRAVLGLRALDAFALAGMAGLLIERASDDPACVILPAPAAVLALQAVIFETGSDRLEAARQIAIIVGAGNASLAAAVVLTALLPPLPTPTAELLLVPASFLAMYLRRYGPLGQGAGVVVFVNAIYNVAFAPTLDSLPWIVLAGITALVSALAVRLCSGAPETDTALLSQARALREQVGFLLRGCRLAIHAARPGDLERAAARRGGVRTAWGELRTAVESQLAPEHPSQERLQRAVLRLYVLEQAATTTGEALAVLAPFVRTLGLRDRALIGRALGRLERLALAGPQPDPVLVDGAAEAQGDLRALAVARTGLDVQARFALVRLAFALARVVRSLREPLDKGGLGAAKAAKGGVARGILPTTRMAFQASAATAVLVAVDLVFRLEHGYWAILTGVLIVANSFGDTWRRGLERAIGTVVGVALGLAIGPLSGHTPAVVLPVAAVAIFTAIVTLKTRYGVSQGAVAFALVIALEVFLQSPLNVLLARIWETAIGGVVGVAASALVLPLRLTAQLTGSARAIIARARKETAATLVAARVGEGPPPTRPGAVLLASWAAEKARFRNLGAETLFRPVGRAARPILLAQLDSLVEQVALLEDGAAVLNGPPDKRLACAINVLTARVEAAFEAVLARLDGKRTPVPPASDDLPALIARALPFEALTPGADATAFEAGTQLLYHASKLVQILADIAAELEPAAP
jgi:hypothetical protein